MGYCIYEVISIFYSLQMAPSSTSSSRTASRIGEKDVKSAIEEVTVESMDEVTVSETAIPVAIIHPNSQRQLSSSLPKESSMPNDIGEWITVVP